MTAVGTGKILVVAPCRTHRGTLAGCGGGSESTSQIAAIKGLAVAGVAMVDVKRHARQLWNHLPLLRKSLQVAEMIPKSPCNPGKYLAILLLSVPLLSGCVAMGIAGVEAAAIATAAVGAGAIAASATSSSANVYVNHAGDQYWVSVQAGSLAEAERVARETATNSCVEHGRKLQIDQARGVENYGLILPPPADRRFTFLIDFHCLDKARVAS